MGQVEVKKRGVDPTRLTDKQVRFVDEYLLDFNGTRAAKAAGYAAGSAQVQGSQLLAHPLIKQLIGKRLGEVREQYRLQLMFIAGEVITAAMRDGKDLFDLKTGKLLPLNKLPGNITRSINSVKQKVTTYTDQDGNSEERVETEITLVPKQAAWDMALKISGEYAADKKNLARPQEGGNNWDELYTRDEVATNVVSAEATVKSQIPLLDNKGK